MTVQQQIAQRVMGLSDEGAVLVGQLLNSLNPIFFAESKAPLEKPDISRRFGAGKGIIRDTDDFDSFNDEIAALFEGTDR